METLTVQKNLCWSLKEFLFLCSDVSIVGQLRQSHTSLEVWNICVY